MASVVLLSLKWIVVGINVNFPQAKLNSLLCFFFFVVEYQIETKYLYSIIYRRVPLCKKLARGSHYKRRQKIHIQPSIETCSDLCIMDSGQMLIQFRLRGRGEGRGQRDLHALSLFTTVYNAIAIIGSLIIFIASTYFLPHYGPGIDSACNRNE